jgi:hypothetical protein
MVSDIPRVTVSWVDSAVDVLVEIVPDQEIVLLSDPTFSRVKLPVVDALVVVFTPSVLLAVHPLLAEIESETVELSEPGLQLKSRL